MFMHSSEFPKYCDLWMELLGTCTHTWLRMMKEGNLSESYMLWSGKSTERSGLPDVHKLVFF